MDNLTMNALAADRMGISYGIYKSIYPTTIEKKMDDGLTEKTCAYCSAKFRTKFANKKFCTQECCIRMQYERKKSKNEA